ncbi:hypothetical protein ACNANV_14765 [Curtobacterium flaccumfaciens pv. flaccumfaciens]|uniref:hypothetical protein n=1 Tax=Curtobacterium flaccumfaciens TaxID=2035 RepID=UPI003A4E3AFA
MRELRLRDRTTCSSCEPVGGRAVGCAEQDDAHQRLVAHRRSEALVLEHGHGVRVDEPVVPDRPVAGPDRGEVPLGQVGLGAFEVRCRVREVEQVALDHRVPDVRRDEQVVQRLGGGGLAHAGASADEQDLGPGHRVSPG